VSLGSTGNKGVVGWYIPPWIAKKHPDITDWKNLGKYAANFKTSESGSKGQLLDAGDLRLDKIVSTKFATSGSPAYELVKKFTWTNDDQNTVAKYIALDEMTPEAAAKKWIEANPAKVKAWLR
jgi:ABC-type proline/glycine betaine transport system substrate-binding protein